MTKEEQVKYDVAYLEVQTVERACDLIQSYNGDLRAYLARFTAALCDVDYISIMTDTKHIDSVRARWLFWYGYRYMTGDSYETIANVNKEWREFAPSSVGAAITKMAMLISKESIWTKRWYYLKKIIRSIQKPIDMEKDLFSSKVVITYPKNVDVELKKI